VSVCFLGDRMSWLTLRSNDSEGCEGDEGFIEDKNFLPVHNRAFLDTNVVWNWHTYGEEIADNMDFDEHAVVAKVGIKGLEDIIGIRELYQVAHHYGSIAFVTSENTLQELNKIRHSQYYFQLEN
jgi:hypothetical protein